MLILKRRTDEEIVIGDNVVVKIVEAGRGFVRLGIDAPKDVRVDRREVRTQRDRGDFGVEVDRLHGLAFAG